MEVESSICLSDLVPALRWSGPQQVAEVLADPRLPAAWWSSLSLSRALGTAGLDWMCERLARLAAARWGHLPLCDLLPALTVHHIDPALPGWPDATRTAVAGLGGWQRLRRLSPGDLSTPSATPEAVIGSVFREILGRVPAQREAPPSPEVTRPLQRGADQPESGAQRPFAGQPESGPQRPFAGQPEGGAQRTFPGQGDGGPTTGSFPAVPAAGPYQRQPQGHPQPEAASAGTGSFPAQGRPQDPGTGSFPAQGTGSFPAQATGTGAFAAQGPSTGSFPGQNGAPGQTAGPGRPGPGTGSFPGQGAGPGQSTNPGPGQGAPGTGAFPVQSGPGTGAFPAQGSAQGSGQHPAQSPGQNAQNTQNGQNAAAAQGTPPSPAQDQSQGPGTGSFRAQPQTGGATGAQPGGLPQRPSQQGQGGALPQRPAQGGGLPQRPTGAQPPRPDAAPTPGAPSAGGPGTDSSAYPAVPSDPDHAMVRVVDGLFRGLDKLELAVAVHRLFAEDPISLRTLAHKLLVDRDALSQAQRTAEERVLHWLRSSESAPVTGHMFRLTEWLGAAATEEQLIGADPAHPVMVPSLRTPLWRVLVTLMPDRRFQDGWLVVGDLHGLQARTRRLLASAPPDADVVELLGELGIRAHSAKAWLDALPPESAPDPRSSVPAPAQPLPRRTPGANGHHHRGGQPIPAAAQGSIDPSAALATLSALSSSRPPILPAQRPGPPATPPPPLPSPSSDPRRWQRIEVTPEHLRGGPVPVPEGYATQLGMRPGTLLSVTGPGDNAIVLVWQGQQPVFDSLQPVLMRLNARPGDQVYVTVDGYRLEAQLTA
uniref:hypothetical protein n=1 Tax=Nonomuraea pusilla TaxID=46177 RepID=UPI0006E1EA64|nr:hypothetical protein [Nonomuraea pusilla]